MRKLGQFYNIKSFGEFKDSAKNFSDSASGLVIAQNLEAIDPQIFEKKYPSLTFLNSGISADNTGGYAETIKSLRTQPAGEYKTSGDRSSDKGVISVEGETSFIPVIPREAQSTWSDSDIQTALMQNINLQSQFLQAHLDIYNREVDQIIGLGIGATKGLMNNALFATGAASDTIGNLTGQQLYDNLAGMIVDQHNQVFNTAEYMANKVQLPQAVYNDAARKILNSAGSEKTVLAALKINFPEVEFYANNRSDKACAYSSNEQAMKIRIPLQFTVSPIVQIGFKFHVESKHRIAGLDILESTAGRYLTGLLA